MIEDVACNKIQFKTDLKQDYKNSSNYLCHC